MGAVEQVASKKRRKRDLQTAAIFAIAAVGLLATPALAPDLARAFGHKKPDARLRYRSKTVLMRLKQTGYVEFIDRDGIWFARLTPKGQQILDLHREKLRIAKAPKKRWDRQYRLVMFDIPEKRKKIRDQIRREVAAAGFLRLQDSAWIYPYDCEEFIALLKADLRIGKDVLYAIVDSIENDSWIRKHFGLPEK
jgi:DNA-binding transcriptional regulator PaaX